MPQISPAYPWLLCMEAGPLTSLNDPLQAAQESTARLQQQQKEPDTRQVALAEHEARLQELQRALTAQQADLQQRQQELQVGALWGARHARQAAVCGLSWLGVLIDSAAAVAEGHCCASFWHTCHQGAPEGDSSCRDISLCFLLAFHDGLYMSVVQAGSPQQLHMSWPYLNSINRYPSLWLSRSGLLLCKSGDFTLARRPYAVDIISLLELHARAQHSPTARA